jgi:hypothetical protein
LTTKTTTTTVTREFDAKGKCVKETTTTIVYEYKTPAAQPWAGQMYPTTYPLYPIVTCGSVGSSVETIASEVGQSLARTARRNGLS